MPKTLMSSGERLLRYARQEGVVRPKDARSLGVDPSYVQRLYEDGDLRRVARGVYIPADAEPDVHHTLAVVSRRIPSGVVCLISALQFHGLTTQMPYEVWVAMDRGKWRPKTDDLPVRVVHFSGGAFASGVQAHKIEGVTVKIYGPAKTVADCFKYRNKIGTDVAIEALRTCLEERLCDRDEIWHFGRICRVDRVMRPYIEAM